MQAMIFAAGMGTRLKPLTDVIPKALVPVDDKPLLQHVMEKMSSANCTQVVVNVHHKAKQIINFINQTKANYDFKISISDESEKLLETGGGIRKAAGLFNADEPLLIHNVDILSNVDVESFYNSIGDADAMLLVSERKTQRYLVFNDEMRLVGWTNIATGEVKGIMPENARLYAFSGIHVINQSLIKAMEHYPERFPIMDFYLNECAERNIRGYLKSDLKLLDVGKLDTLEAAGEFINQLS